MSPTSAPTLTLGVRGTIGSLMWFDATSALVPADGTNSEYVDYFTMDGHKMVMSRHAELPIARVHEALREFARSTQQLPTCVDWTPKPELPRLMTSANAWVPRSTVEEALAESLRTAQRQRAVECQAYPDPIPDMRSEIHLSLLVDVDFDFIIVASVLMGGSTEVLDLVR
ncbi:Imm1 family immunity protein [Saccharopolyspora hattusasensis]|uniref:Imm1 family immunity protein n=1 Tax=Saccharopolyspora hattusasensis TaxID=1128679 RepID=UPI003D968B62